MSRLSMTTQLETIYIQSIYKSQGITKLHKSTKKTKIKIKSQIQGIIYSPYHCTIIF